MYDATLLAAEIARRRSTILETLQLVPRRYAVATIHRAASTGDGAALGAIVAYLEERAAATPVVLPLHPRTRLAAQRFGLSLEKLRVCEPIGYLDMQRLLQDASAVFHRFGRTSEGSLFPSRAVRHPARRDRVGRDGRSGLEPPLARPGLPASAGDRGVRRRACRRAHRCDASRGSRLSTPAVAEGPSVVVSAITDFGHSNAASIHVLELARSFFPHRLPRSARSSRTPSQSPSIVETASPTPFEISYFHNLGRWRLPNAANHLLQLRAILRASSAGAPDLIYLRSSPASFITALGARLRIAARIVTEHNGWLADEGTGDRLSAADLRGGAADAGARRAGRRTTCGS